MFFLSQQLITIAEGYIKALEASEANLVAPVINPTFPVIAASPVPAVAQEPPLIDVTWSVPNAPAPFTGSVNVSGLPGPFTTLPPTLSFPAPPVPFTGAVPGSPSLNLNFNYPSPSIALPGAPSLLSLDTVSFTPFTIPAFTANVPTLTLDRKSVV